MGSVLKRWTFPSSTGSHFDFLDGLRGIAILAVVFFHTLYTNPDHGLIARIIGWGILGGWMGVPIFFVLSGFLISYPFFKKKASNSYFWHEKGYFRRRFAKIIPPYYLSIVFFTACYFFETHDRSYFYSAFQWATGLANFMPVYPILNGSYWSLLIEVHFYLLLPILFYLCRGIDITKSTYIIFIFLLVIPFTVRFISWPNGIDKLPNYSYFDPLWLSMKRFPAKLDYFGWGVLFAGIYSQINQSVNISFFKPFSLIGTCGITLLPFTFIIWGYWVRKFDIYEHPNRWSIEVEHFMPSIVTFFILFLIFNQKCLFCRLLSFAPLRFIGIVSYEWFLFHGPIVRWFLDNTSSSHGSVIAYAWRTIFPLILSFIMSAVFYYYVSFPILGLIRGHFQKNKFS